MGLFESLAAAAVAYLLASTSILVSGTANAMSANSMFFGLDGEAVKPPAPQLVFLSDSEASAYPDYAYAKGILDTYYPSYLNSKAKTASCLKELNSFGFNSAQIFGENPDGKILFSAYGNWKSDGSLVSMGQAFSDRGADLKIYTSLSSARKYAEGNDTAGALAWASGGDVKVEPSWGKFALLLAAGDCFKRG